MRRFPLFLFVLLMLASLTRAQETHVVRPVRVGESRPLRELAQEYQNKRLALHKTLAGDREIPNRPPVNRLPDDNRQDPLWQRTQGENVGAPLTVIEGVSSDDNAAAFGFRVMPPDVNGDVGTGHIVETVNLLYRIWNKSGTPLIAPTPTDALWNGFGGNCELNNDGDPVVIYDHVNDRWIISQFVFSVSQCIACSKTGDPTGAYWLYEFPTPGNDYPKMSVMPSAYYGTIRNFSATFKMDAHAWNDDKMRAGNPTTEMLVRTLTGVSGIDGVQPADLAGPPPATNTSGHFVGHDDAGDRLYTYELTPNFPAGTSTLTGPAFIPVASYSSAFAGGFFGSSIPQPGTTQVLDVLGPFTRFAPNFRDFGTHQTMIVNHVVDVNDFTDHAGERWYELRKIGAGAWTVFQSGTYAPDAHHRWMGNAAMNGDGAIGLAYSISSGTLSPSVRYTGRNSTDPLGTMTLAEGTIAAGSGSQLGGSRWGDYSRITVDPSDDKTFWYFGEYVQATGSFEWNTKIGSFQVSSSSPTADVLIWLPPNVPSPDFARKARERGLSEEQVRAMAQAPLSHTALQAALTANGKTSVIVSDITTVNLSSYQAVLVLLGIFPNNHVVLANSSEALAIVNYIQSGGKIYMEGGDMWYFDPLIGGHDFAPLFGLDGVADGPTPGDLRTVLGVTGSFTQGLKYKYTGLNNYIDHLTATGSGFVIHTNQSPAYNCAVAQNNASSNAKTIGTAFEFGGLVDNAGGPTKASLMQKYLQHLGIQPALSINDVTVTEGDAGTANATFTVTLSSPSSQSVTVNYATANGTATASSDYIASSGTLTFTSGNTTQSVTVLVNGDVLSESNETFFVNLSNNSSNAVIADAQGLATIIDDDAQMLIWQPADVSNPDISQKARQRGLTEAQVLAMVKSPESVSALQAALTANCKSSVVVTDITSINLSKFQAVFAVLGIFPNNHVIPANSAEALALANYIQNGGEVYMEGGDVWFYDPANVGGHNFAALFGLTGLTDGSGDLATVNGVTGTITQGLNFAYGGQNNFIDQLGVSGSGFAIHTNSSPAYNCGMALNNTSSGAKTIGNALAFGGLTDNTSTKTDLMRQYLSHFGVPSLSISINDATVTEGNSGTVNANFTVSLSAASSQPVTVNYATANGTATAGSDYVAGSGTVTFPVGNTAQTVSVAVIGDAVYEPSENFFLNLSNPTCATLADAQGLGTILNDDALVFNPTDDAHTNSNLPTTNYGAATTLRMKQATQIFNSYLKFTVSGVTGTITSAKVRMKVVAASNSGGSIYSVSTSWSEGTITYNNAPPISGTPLDTKGSVTVNQIVEFNVAAVVVGNGTYSFGLKNSSTTAVQYDSDEATRTGFMRPELMITTSTASATAKAAEVTSFDAEAEIEKAAALPERLTLSANYPNPFNPQTQIQYGLPELAKVRLAIYSITGQIVRTLVDETQPAGYKQVLWDGKNESAQSVSSGVYLYVLEVGRQKMVRKMILQK